MSANAAPAAPIRQPDALDRFGERLADRVNPIIVKEVRQGLRTRVFWIFFSLMLVSCLFISLFFFAANDGMGERSGQPAFIAFFVCLALVQFFVIPYVAYRSMAREAEDETWVLLTLTGLGPRRILAGKLGSSVLQGTLYASAATPFLLFSYFLNGIDLPTIIVGVAVSIAYQVFLVSVSVSLATLAESRIVRALLHFVLLGVLLQGLGFGIAGSVAIGEFAQKVSGSAAFWISTVSVFFGMLSTGLLLFEAAAARLSLPTEDYTRGPRSVYVVQFIGAAALFVWGWMASGESEVLTAGSVTLSLYATLVGLFVASDRDGMAKVHWAHGGRFSFLKPGGFRGYLLVTGLLMSATLAFFGLALFDGKLGMGPMLVLVAAPAFALMMLSLPIVVSRWIPHPPWQTPAMIRLVFLGLVVLMTGVPPLIGEIVSDADDLFLNALNPVVGLINIERQSHDGVALTLLVWGAALGLGASALFSLRARDTEWLA
ncbi:MAG: ABC transporter permease [Archangium sp.]|nr:ABC transporter permease [Archangium sp.]